MFLHVLRPFDCPMAVGLLLLGQAIIDKVIEVEGVIEPAAL